MSKKWRYLNVLFIALFLMYRVFLRSSSLEYRFHHHLFLNVLFGILISLIIASCIAVLITSKNVIIGAMSAIIISCIVFILVFAPDTTGVLERQLGGRVSHNMRTLRFLVEDYRIQKNTYPLSLNDIDYDREVSVFGDDYVKFGPSSESKKEIATRDPFAKPDEEERVYRYWFQPSAVEGEADECFIWSRGPDTQFDIEPEILQNILENEGLKGTIRYLKQKEYDVTNGCRSSGDIISYL